MLFQEIIITVNIKFKIGAEAGIKFNIFVRSIRIIVKIIAENKMPKTVFKTSNLLFLNRL